MIETSRLIQNNLQCMEKSRVKTNVKGVAISTDVLVRDIMSGLTNKTQLMKARFQSHKVLAEQVISLFYT